MNMVEHTNVLILTIGRSGYLVDFIKETEGFAGKVYTADYDVTSAGMHRESDGQCYLPNPYEDEKKYVEAILEFCINNGVKIVLPIMDNDAKILSGYKNMFEEYGILAVVSSPEVVDICDDKARTNDFLEAHGFPVIKTYDDIERFEKELEEGNIDFPVFVKPKSGIGSENIYKANSLGFLKDVFKPGMLIQQYLDGQEYGVDIFNNDKLVPVRLAVKKKLNIRAGATDKAVTVYDDQIEKMMLNLASKLKHFGPIDCDVIKYEDKVYVLDINARIGGGYPATHLAGINYFELLIKMIKGEEILGEFRNYKTNLLLMKDVGLRVRHDFNM